MGANRNPGVVIKYWKKNTGLVGANRDLGVVIKYGAKHRISGCGFVLIK